MNRRELMAVLDSMPDTPVLIQKGPTGRVVDVKRVTYYGENNVIVIVAEGSIGGRPRAELTQEQAQAAVLEHGTISAAARALGIPRTTVDSRL